LWSLIGVIHIFIFFLLLIKDLGALFIFINFVLLILNLVFNPILFSVKGNYEANKYGNPPPPNSLYLKVIFVFSLVVIIVGIITLGLIGKDIYEEQKYESQLLRERQNF